MIIGGDRVVQRALLRLRRHAKWPPPPRRESTSSFNVLPQLRLPALLYRFAGDDQLLDLAGTFVDAEQADVAVEPLDAVIGDIAGAAEDLDGAVGDAADHLAGEIFGGRGLEGDRLAPGPLTPRSPAPAPSPPCVSVLRIGDHRLDQLEVGERLAELPALGRIGDGIGDQPLGDADADRGDVQPAAVEHAHRDPEALAFLGRGGWRPAPAPRRN